MVLHGARLPIQVTSSTYRGVTFETQGATRECRKVVVGLMNQPVAYLGA